MIKWDLPKHNVPKPVLAKKCKSNPGVLDSAGVNINYPTRIWVDDALIAAVDLTAMKMALAAVIEAIFVVMGQPDLTLRQCPLAMDKWKKLVVGEKQLALGLILNTREMTVSITHEYLCSTLHLIKTNWSKCKKRFSALEASKMAGKLARLTESDLGPATCFHNCTLLLHLLWHKTSSCWQNHLLSSKVWQKLFLLVTSAHLIRTTRSTRVL